MSVLVSTRDLKLVDPGEEGEEGPADGKVQNISVSVDEGKRSHKTSEPINTLLSAAWLENPVPVILMTAPGTAVCGTIPEIRTSALFVEIEQLLPGQAPRTWFTETSRMGVVPIGQISHFDIGT